MNWEKIGNGQYLINSSCFLCRCVGVLSAEGYASKILQILLFTKSVSDLLLLSDIQEINEIHGDELIGAYKLLSNVIDCSLIFK